MSEYIPSPRSWVSEHVEQYEGSGGTEGAVYIAPEFPDGLRMILVTHRGRKTGATRKTPLNPVEPGCGWRQLRVGGVYGGIAQESPLVS